MSIVELKQNEVMSIAGGFDAQPTLNFAGTIAGIFAGIAAFGAIPRDAVRWHGVLRAAEWAASVAAPIAVQAACSWVGSFLGYVTNNMVNGDTKNPAPVPATPSVKKEL